MAVYRVSPELGCQTLATAILTLAGVTPTPEVIASSTALLKAFAEGVGNCA